MKDDKKKLMVVIALGVVCVGVGAFQFMSSGPAPKPVAKQESTKKAEDAKAEASGDGKTHGTVAEGGTTGDKKDPMNQLYTMALSPRDPFDEGNLPGLDTNSPTTAQTPNTQTNPQPTSTSGQRPGGRRPGGNASTFVPPVLPGNLNGSGLPNVQISPDGSMPIETVDGGYSVSGVIQGEKNAAIVTDSSGNQRMVQEGQSLDGDTKVVSVKNGNVVVRRKGKNVTLKMGGNP